MADLVPPRLAWACTHGESQRWGHRHKLDGGSYRTDWNACSLSALDEPDEGVSVARDDLPSKCCDLVLGLVLIKPAFTYHSLCNLSRMEQKQQTFWASVFGNSMHGTLYFFSLAEGKAAFRFPMPVNIPVVDRRRLKTFFCSLDVGAGIELVKSLDGILPETLASMASSCTFCVRLPAYFAWALVNGKAESFALPDPDVEDLFHSSRRVRSRIVGWSYWPGSFATFEPPMFLEQSEDFSSAAAGRIATLIKSFASQISWQEGNEETLHECHLAVSTLMWLRDELSTQGLHQGVLQLRGRVNAAGQLPYQASFLIKTLLMCSHLRDSADLKKVLRKAMDMALPKSLARELITKFFDSGEKVKIPKPSKLTRARFMLDAALMIFNREINCKDLCMQKPHSPIRFAMVDSSVQGHYNLELLRVVSIDGDHVVDLFVDAMECLTEAERIVIELLADRELQAADWMLYLEAEEHRFQTMKSCMRLSLFPAVALGNQQLYHKFHAVAHALFLETGSAQSLASFASQISAFCTDQGTEFALPKIPAVPIYSLFGFLRPSDDDMDWAPEMLDFGERCAEPCVDFSKAIAIAGLLHIIHNSSSDLGKSMSCWDTVIQQLQHVSRLLRRRESKTRLMESCFNDPIGKHFHAEIKAFQCKLHTGRWGSVAACILGVLGLETVLQYGWDASKYKNGRVLAGHDGDEANPFGVDIAVVDGAIKSEIFWARLKMLESLAVVLQKCLAWAEGCPCHSNLELPAGQASDTLRRLWFTCPLRGCRAPELAAGDFFEVFRKNFQQSSAALLLSLPRDLSSEDRMNLLHDFESAKNHLHFVFRLRLAFWFDLPWKVYGCAHPNPAVHKKFLEDCLNATCEEVASCPLLQELHCESVKAEVNQYLLEGRELATSAKLCRFLARLCFCPTAERAVEGDHAIVHRKVALARNHTMAYISLSRRMVTVQNLIDEDPENLTRLAAIMQKTHSPALILTQLGLANHPSTAYLTNYRDPLHMSIVYRSDGPTMFQSGLDLVPPDTTDATGVFEIQDRTTVLIIQIS